MSRSNTLKKVIFPLIAMALAAFMAASCGGGGGAPSLLPLNPGGNPGGLQVIPIPGQQVQSASIDWTKVVAATSGMGGLVIRGTAGAAIANAEVRAIDQNGLTAYTTAATDGSFDFNTIPVGYWGVSGAPVTLNQTGQGLAPSLDVTVNFI